MLTANGSGFSGQTAVKLTNINSGYTLNTSGLPAGASVTGYTGSRSETLTITVPTSAAGQSFSISAQGSDTPSQNKGRKATDDPAQAVLDRARKRITSSARKR